MTIGQFNQTFLKLKAYWVNYFQNTKKITAAYRYYIRYLIKRQPKFQK